MVGRGKQRSPLFSWLSAIFVFFVASLRTTFRISDFPLRRAVLLVTLLLPFVCCGVERFPPPEFEPGTYTMPPTTTPAARAHFMEFVDVALLLAALSFSTYAVHKKRLRKWVFWIMAGSLLYFGFVRKGCICPIGSIQDVTLALFHHGYAVPLSVVVFFLLPLVFTLFFGRTFCAAVCPLGAAQDVVLWKPVKVKPWLEHALSVVPFVYLGAAVLFAATGTAFVICEWDPFVSFFRRSGSFKMLAIGAGFLAVGLFIGRPYCRFLCPYGAVLSLLSRIAKWNVTLTPDDCLKCQICDVACPFGAIAEPDEVARLGAAQPLPKANNGPSGWRLAALGLVTLLLMSGGAWLGRQMAVPMSKMNRTVSLAERIAGEESGQIKDQDNPSKAFRGTGKPIPELYSAAFRVREQFRFGGLLLGAFVGLMVGAKLISLSFDEPHTIYEPDRAACVACGRCYTYCPKELVKVKRSEKKEAVRAG
jgi:NosR/NirI family transcriptional regulator, nitrous oxide reductase regulator